MSERLWSVLTYYREGPKLMSRLRAHPAYPYAIRILFAGLAVILILQALRMWHAMHYGSPGTNDFSAFWSAGQLLRRGENPHDVERLLAVETSLGWSKPFPLVMVNPPWLLIWLFPLFLVDFRIAALVWLGTNLAIVLTASSLLWLIFNSYQATRDFPIAWIAGVTFAPALLALRMGQVSALVLAGVVGFLFFIQQEQDLLAGASLALTTVKPHTVYLVWGAVIWWTLTQRRWKVLAGCGIILAISSVAMTALRTDWILDYRAAMQNLPLYWATPTIGGALRGFAGIQTPLVQYLAPAVTGLLTAAYLLYRRPAIVWEHAMSPILLLSVATAAYGWTYDQIVLLVAYLQIVSWLVNKDQYSTADRTVVVAGLILYSGILIAQNLLRINELFFLWAPWSLGAVYLYAWSRRNPTPRLCFVRRTVAFMGRRI